MTELTRTRPVGFDIEWRVILRNGSKPLDHRVAVVQVADGSGLILVIQIHPMSRMLSIVSSTVFGKNLYRFPKEASGMFPFSCTSVLISFQELIENEEIPKLGVNITSRHIHRLESKADYVQTTGQNYSKIMGFWRRTSSN